MPAYPCFKCQTPVDTSGDGRCKKCSEARPFQCSRCNRQMDLLSVYQPEKLSFRKPLFCLTCGPSAESVECRSCGDPLTRINGHEVARADGTTTVYHPECYQKQARMYATVRPAALLSLLLIGAYLGYMTTLNWMGAFIGALLGVPVGDRLSRPFSP